MSWNSEKKNEAKADIERAANRRRVAVTTKPRNVKIAHRKPLKCHLASDIRRFLRKAVGS